MIRPNLYLRALTASAGVLLLLIGLLTLNVSVFGTTRFVEGALLHMLGVALCVALVYPVERYGMGGKSRVQAEHDGSVDLHRPAHFHVGVQTIRLGYGLILAVYVLISFLAGASQLARMLLLRKQAVQGVATITGTSFREPGPMITVTYSFPTKGLPVADNFRAPRNVLSAMRTGNTLSIWYLPENPNIHSWQYVNNALIAQRSLSGLLLFAVGLTYVAGPMCLAEARLRRQLRLARTGQTATGNILGCKVVAYGGKRRGYILTYEFATPAGRVWRGLARIPCISGEPTLVGFPVTILYDPANPHWNRPLAAFPAVTMTTMRKGVLAV